MFSLWNNFRNEVNWINTSLMTLLVGTSYWQQTSLTLQTNNLMQIFIICIASSVAVSAWTLVAISCERYYAIVHPLKSRRWQTLSHAYKLIALIWCGSLLFMSPIAVLSRLIPTSQGNQFFFSNNFLNDIKWIFH